MLGLGDAQVFGSLTLNPDATPVSAIIGNGSGTGYWLLDPDAWSYSFTTATPEGSFPGSSAIVAAAASQVAPDPDTGCLCNPYGPCEEWCALFATWVWRHAGIPIPSYAFTGDIYDWAAFHGALLPPTATPDPGDAVLYGTGPQTVVDLGACGHRGAGLARRRHRHGRGQRRTGTHRLALRHHQRPLPAVWTRSRTTAWGFTPSHSPERRIARAMRNAAMRWRPGCDNGGCPTRSAFSFNASKPHSTRSAPGPTPSCARRTGPTSKPTVRCHWPSWSGARPSRWRPRWWRPQRSTIICAAVEVSGPGFINLTLSDAFVADQVAAVSADARLGVAVTGAPQTMVIDYSGPNVAKEMHVGHLRSTVIGDSLARVLGFLGHEVLRENHIGDWGTPFGMLIEHLIDVGGAASAESFSVRDLNEFYAQARLHFDRDPAFGERCRQRVVLLQGGDPETLRLWEIFVAESLRHIDEVYGMLGVLLTDDDVAGESSYNPLLDVVVDELGAQGLLVEDDGALCVFPEGFTNRQGDPLPLIVRKSDGGYGYPATDLACIRDRTQRRGATTLVYVVGAEQALHLRLVFAVARLAGYLPDASEAVHVGFGLILGCRRQEAGQPDRGFRAPDRLAGRRGDPGERLHGRAPERPQRRAAGPGGSFPRHRRGQVRRPVDRADAGLRLRLGPHAGLRRQYRPVPAVRACPHPFDLPPGGDAAAPAGDPARWWANPRSGPWPCSCSVSRPPSRRRRRRTARPSSARTCSTWPRRSPPSTRPAGSWSTTRRCGRRAWRSAT